MGDEDSTTPILFKENYVGESLDIGYNNKITTFKHYRNVSLGFVAFFGGIGALALLLGLFAGQQARSNYQLEVVSSCFVLQADKTQCDTLETGSIVQFQVYIFNGDVHDLLGSIPFSPQTVNECYQQFDDHIVGSNSTCYWFRNSNIASWISTSSIVFLHDATLYFGVSLMSLEFLCVGFAGLFFILQLVYQKKVTLGSNDSFI